MGVKDLWSVLTPHAERKPIFELRGKTVAIDLAGWVCESLNVVDYFVHPRHHLKNLFFRTCYLIWEEVTPVFVLEGVAPRLKSQVIAKRNDIQFRGVKPKDKPPAGVAASAQIPKEKGRTRFNHVLKQCESLLISMGIQCIQAPGEAEAYCAFLNKKGLVDGVISQDSDCFAYGAVRVYRNFSVSTQGAQSAQGGAVDIYDMSQIRKHLDFGQHKIIVMALLCGCDYCPEGIDGVGRDGVLKLFNKYKEIDILHRVRSWRSEDAKYTAIEMRVDDKSICNNCGHMGRTQSHTKSGCGICRTNRGCNESLWKEERLSLKAELMLRKKALSDPTFPNEEIIKEFLTDPPSVPSLNLRWKQPNIIKFIKQIGNLLQWTEIYCFQKFFPILTRWQVCNAKQLDRRKSAIAYVEPKEIIKKRTVKGVPSLELIWRDHMELFNGLIPDEQLKEFELENVKGMQELWSTVEPLSLMEESYPEIVKSFLKSKEKPKKAKKINKAKQKVLAAERSPLGSLENLSDLITATDEIAKCIKPKRARAAAIKKKSGLQLIDKFFKETNTPNAVNLNSTAKFLTQCSTPRVKCLPFVLEESDSDEDNFNMSEIVNEIVKSSAAEKIITQHAGHRLHYEPISSDLSLLINESRSRDDLDLLVVQKRDLSINQQTEQEPKSKRMSLDDSFDMLVNEHNKKNILNRSKSAASPFSTHLDRFKQQHQIMVDHKSTIKAELSRVEPTELDDNVSYFFNQSVHSAHNEDAFEKLMDASMKIHEDDENFILIDDSTNDNEDDDESV